MRRAEQLRALEAERQQVHDKITNLYWAFSRQARAKPPCVVAPHLYSRRRELDEQIAALRRSRVRAR